MKRILPIFLIILLFCVTTLNGENRRIDKKKLGRMIKHISKIKNLLRNLQSEPQSGSESEPPEESVSQSGSESSEESGSQSSEESGSEPSEESGSQSSEKSGSEPSEDSGSQFSEELGNEPSSSNTTDTPLTANDNFKGRNRDARINIVAFNSFLVRGNYITFAVFFLFNTPPIAQTIVFILTIRHRRRSGFRYLQEDKNETATCTTESQKTEGNIKYSCSSQSGENYDDSIIDQVAIVDLNIPGVSLEEINFSDEALLAASNLQNYTNEIEEMYTLKNGELKVHPNKYFVIKGDIDDDDYKGKKGDGLILHVYDYSNNIQKNASCSIQSVTNKQYEFKCTSGEIKDGNLHLSTMYYDNDKKAINLFMNKGNETLSFDGSNNGDTFRNNPIYKKSSSGLSGGAIAGIVIACAVVLIIASIISMMLKKPSIPINNNTSIAELRSIDNFTQ